MRDRERTANSHCAWEEIGQNPKVINKKAVNTRSKRNLKRNRSGERKQTNQNIKNDKRFSCIDRVNWTPNPIDDYKSKVRTLNP